MYIPSFSSKRGHVTEKHVLTGHKHDMLGNQTFEVRRPLSKLSHQSWKAFHVFDKQILPNFKPGIPLSKDFRNEAIHMAATQLISEIRERYRMYRFRTSNVWLPSLSCLRPDRTCFTVTCPRLDENDGIKK